MSESGPEREPSGRGAEMVWSIIGTLIAGVLAWGGIGWLLDRWLGTRYLVAVGIVVGMAGAFYLIVKRYGSS
ncbi:MAG TPA: AtpZ/AtpI family protein [Propionibacteriaceae bacterium]|jgi:F0F1-type ATP synthase assembly protein I|nr:AtpZ/AtpI family protein [Propionibacteriaceae bacterium]